MNYIVGIFAILVNKDKNSIPEKSSSVQYADNKEFTNTEDFKSMSKLEQFMSE